MKTLILLALGSVAMLFSSCSRKARASSEWDVFGQRYLDAYFAAHPDVAVVDGRHEFDGKLPDFSRDALDREIARLHAERQRAEGFRDAALSDRQQFERGYLMAAIESDLFWIESAQWPYRNPYFYNDAIDPQVYLTRPYAPLDRRMRAFVDYERVLPKALEQIRANLRVPLPRTYVARGSDLAGGMAQYFAHDVPGIFASVADAQLQSRFRTSNDEAIRALQALQVWFESQKAKATDSFALGAEKLREMVHATERVDLPLDQLESIGRQDLEKNLAALRDACAQFAPGRSAADCVAKMNADKPSEGPLEAARAQVKELKDFVRGKNLVTIPGTEQANVDESPQYQRWNDAYINIPGPYEKGVPSIYYISPPDSKWSPAERAAYIPATDVLLFTSVHEVMPGHFLQYLHANRVPSQIGRVLSSYAFTEGWAHYTEEMMWDAGLGSRRPEAHLGQLTQALLRDVRLVSAIGMHSGRMSVEESERLFREQAFQDAATARQQAARGTFDPAYLNYTMGKLMIRKLRDDWTASRGGRDAWRAFHDQFLGYGAPPIPLIRSAMLRGSPGPPL